MRRSRLAVYTQILSHMKVEPGAFEPLVQLILDYAGTHLGMTLGFMKIPLARSTTVEEAIRTFCNQNHHDYLESGLAEVNVDISHIHHQICESSARNH